MTKCVDLYDEAKNNPAGLRFTELKKLCKCVGMRLDRTKGSHFIYRSDDHGFTLSIQKMRDGKAKSYQVKQLIDFIDDHRLITKEPK